MRTDPPQQPPPFLLDPLAVPVLHEGGELWAQAGDRWVTHSISGCVAGTKEGEGEREGRRGRSSRGSVQLASGPCPSTTPPTCPKVAAGVSKNGTLAPTRACCDHQRNPTEGPGRAGRASVSDTCRSSLPSTLAPGTAPARLPSAVQTPWPSAWPRYVLLCNAQPSRCWLAAGALWLGESPSRRTRYCSSASHGKVAPGRAPCASRGRRWEGGAALPLPRASSTQAYRLYLFKNKSL